uniref:Sodium/calcium exchanger membrane region domain-containing protein n=1 Tax=Geospiza parvula TaxID=87175 RepID=A0A8C3N591_GEOPR
MGQGPAGLPGALSLPGVLSLPGALPAGPPLLLDAGHTVPPGGDALSLDCWEVREYNSSEWCHFVRSNPDCRIDGGFLDYLDGVFCVFPPRLLPLAVTLYALWLLYLFIILGVTAEKFFCPNLSAISTNLKLSHNVAVSLASHRALSQEGCGDRAGEVAMTGSLCVPLVPCQGKPIGRLEWDEWSCAGAGQRCTAPVSPRGGGHQVFSLTSPLHGVTFLAFGNGAPDVFSAVVAFSDPRTAGLAIGAIFGAGVFVTTVVAGGIALVKPFTAASRPFLRDVIFYMVAVFLTFVVLYLGRIRLGEALGYLGLYVFYVLTVVLCTWIHRRQRGDGLAPPGAWEPEMPTDVEEPEPSSTNSGDYGEEYRPLLPSRESSLRILTSALSPLDCRKWRRKPWYWRLFKAFRVPVELVLLLTVPVVDPDKDDLNWKRPLNCLHILTSPLLCVLTLKSGAYGLYQIQGIFPVWALVTLVASALALIIFITTSNEEPPKYHCVFAFLGFLASAMWINAAATELVNILRTLGIIFQLSNTVLGLTLLAWGNSIGDTFSDLTMARQGYPRMAFSACFGGIIFSILSMPGPGCCHLGQELPKFPCLQPRRALCAVGSLERSWDPFQSPSNAGKARSVPTVQGDSEGFGRGRDTASSTPVWGQDPQLWGQDPPCPHSCPSWAGVWAGACRFGILQREGGGAVPRLSGFWVKPLLECSGWHSAQRMLQPCRKEEEGGQRDGLSAVCPS